MAVLVDTSVIIAAERAERALAQAVAPDTDAAVSAVTVAELQRGVERATGARQRRRREDELLSAVGLFPTLPVDGVVALAAAEIWVDLERQGMVIPIFDLLIAATAIVTERTLIAADARHFPRVEGLELRLIETA